VKEDKYESQCSCKPPQVACERRCPCACVVACACLFALANVRRRSPRVKRSLNCFPYSFTVHSFSSKQTPITT
jgi:hypothetical protein